MKMILFLMLTFSSVSVFYSQTSPSSHDWILCDGNGSPIKSSGQNFYVVFRGSRIEMYCGKDLSTAKSNGVTKSGSYGYDSNFIWWTWSDGEKSGDWVFSNNLMSSQNGKAMLRDVVLFK